MTEWAKMVNALPFRGLFSNGAWPLLGPEVPARFPADALVHVSRRH